MIGVFKKIYYFYFEGFKAMTIGRKLWTIIIIKLFIMFAILKLFFFHDFLSHKFNTDKERTNYVIDQLTR